MLMVNHLIGFGVGGGGSDGTAFGALTELGLSGNTILCLDAGDALSYTSGQTFTDRSAAAYDFWLGTGAGAEGSDPTFNGVAGALSSAEYFSSDGGDQFTAKTSPTAVDAFHKDSANFSIVAIHRWGSAADAYLLDNCQALTGPGFSVKFEGGNKIRFFASYGGATALDKTADGTTTTGAWHFHGISINEAVGAGGGFFYEDGAYKQVGGANTFDATYASPSASAAYSPLRVWTYNGSNFAPSGSRLGVLLFFDTALSKAQMDSVFTALGPRFGL